VATVTHRRAFATTNNQATYASGAFTPGAGELLVVGVIVSGTALATPTISSDTQGLGFTLVGQRTWAAAHKVYVFVADKFAAASSEDLTVDVTGDDGTGCIIFVVGVSGMHRVGAAAVRQTAEANGATGTTPAVTFASAVLTDNPTIGWLGNATNPAGMTPPTSWTEPIPDTGFATPTIGGEEVARNSGFTGTTVTWGSTSSTHGEVMVELDASVPTLAPSAIASAEAVGAQKLNRTMSLAGIASAQAFGTTKLNRTMSPVAIGSGQALGSPTVARGPVTLLPAAIASAQAFGTAKLDLRLLLSAIASGEVLGSPAVIAGGGTIAPGSIGSAEAHGTPVVVPGAVVVLPASIGSAETLGAPLLRTLTTLVASGIGSAENVPAPLLTALWRIMPTALASGEALGAPIVRSEARVSVAGIVSAEVLGSPIVRTEVVLTPAGIVSAEALGLVSVARALGPSGIASLEALGSPALHQLLRVAGIATAEAFGLTLVTHAAQPGSAVLVIQRGSASIDSRSASGKIAVKSVGSGTLTP
jgi:hypothetical protein